MTLTIQRIRELLTPTYTIDRELGRGGMATVYLAQDSKHDRVVACSLVAVVKILLASEGAKEYLL